MYFELFFVFITSLSSLFILRKVAKVIGLVDKPNKRKLHKGSIPLVGGLAICVSIIQFMYYRPEILPYSHLYILCILVLIFVGVIDDKYDISFKIRLSIQAILSLFMMFWAGLELHTLGDMLALGDINLGYFGYIITIIAVIGAINAFNMVDGIDGLLGGLSIVTFGSLGVMLLFDGQENLAYVCLVFIVAIIPYILFNVGILGRKRKVFMGDAGSMLIGFSVIWMLLLASQNGTTAPLRPVTALWLIAIPLMDMATIMIRRIRRGDSPFKPDREHLHHIFQRLGFNSRQTVAIICFLSTLLASFGILGELYNIPEYIMFFVFIVVFLIYLKVISNIWLVTKKIRIVINKARN